MPNYIVDLLSDIKWSQGWKVAQTFLDENTIFDKIVEYVLRSQKDEVRKI